MSDWVKLCLVDDRTRLGLDARLRVGQRQFI